MPLVNQTDLTLDHGNIPIMYYGIRSFRILYWVQRTKEWTGQEESHYQEQQCSTNPWLMRQQSLKNGRHFIVSIRAFALLCFALAWLLGWLTAQAKFALRLAPNTDDAMHKVVPWQNFVRWWQISNCFHTYHTTYTRNNMRAIVVCGFLMK